MGTPTPDDERSSRLISNYRRTLPHWLPRNATFFVTFRLANSLPAAVLQALQNEREHERQAICARLGGGEQRRALYDLDKKMFGRYDAWLDKCVAESPRWLAQAAIADIVCREIHRLDGERYTVLAFCVMPNHVHLLLDTTNYDQIAESNRAGTTRRYPLTDTLRLLKGRTARACNLALSRAGAFWQHESYDHVVRNERELIRIFGYILYNPVKAGLVANWEDWKHTYSVVRD